MMTAIIWICVVLAIVAVVFSALAVSQPVGKNPEKQKSGAGRFKIVPVVLTTLDVDAKFTMYPDGPLLEVVLIDTRPNHRPNNGTPKEFKTYTVRYFGSSHLFTLDEMTGVYVDAPAA